MRSLAVLPIAVAIISAVPSLPAKATPLSNLEAPLAGERGPILKAHGWHYDCLWGPFRYHRHVPGVGNVRCGDDPDYDGGYWHRYDDEDRYDRRRYDHGDWNRDHGDHDEYDYDK